MTDVELWVPQDSNTVVNPVTGESLDLIGAEWERLAHIRATIIELGHRTDELAHMLDSEVARRLDLTNDRHIEVDGYRLTVNAPRRTAWDVPKLMQVLTELVSEGRLARGAAQRAIKTEVSHKPVAREVTKLVEHDDPMVRDRIKECRTIVPATRRVTVTGGPK
jgi:hypothetical protein